MTRRTIAAIAVGMCLALPFATTSMAKGKVTPPTKAKPKPKLKLHAPADPAIELDYNGKLQDEKGQPVSGVFNLEFKLYDGQHAAKSTWHERHFVAVVDGKYTVPLGARQKLYRRAVPQNAWIGVELVGEGEILRDRFQVESASDKSGDSKSADKFTMSAETRKLLEDARKGKRIAFADVAERAVTADHANSAKRADMVGDMTAEQINKKVQLALDRLGEHIADPNAHAATGGIRLGKDRRVGRGIGGDGGSPYEVDCPPGYVVTGIKGRAGNMVDNVTVVCHKLR